MTKEDINKFAKWFKEADKETRHEIRKYIFEISNMDANMKSRLWERIMKRALK